MCWECGGWSRRADHGGETRYLFCVVIRFPDGNGYPVTAREMTANEKRRYRKWKGR